VPGSYFAPTFNWSEYDVDLTPTGEELELTDLFPGDIIVIHVL